MTDADKERFVLHETPLVRHNDASVSPVVHKQRAAAIAKYLESQGMENIRAQSESAAIIAADPLTASHAEAVALLGECREVLHWMTGYIEDDVSSSEISAATYKNDLKKARKLLSRLAKVGA